MKHYLYIIFILVLFSCEETIVLDTGQVDPQLIIDARITDENKIHIISLTKSVDFYYDQQPPRVKEATITVEDITEGITYNFEHNPSGESESNGFYYSEVAFEGAVGHIYQLNVSYQGEEYIGIEEMPDVSPIDSLNYRINPFELEDEDNGGRYYEVLLFAEEPQDMANYYYFEFFRNDSLILDDPTSLYVTDDALLQERIQDLPSPVYYAKNEQATVRMFGITREAYIYFSDLFNVLNNDSGMFSPPPANPRNNISNGALGYFLVASVSSSSIVIE